MANLFAFRKSADRVLHPIVSGLSKLPLHANAWTLIGAAIGLVGGVVLFYGMWWLGFALLIARGLIDHIDGYKARTFNQRSTFGAVMDDVCDRWVLGVMYAGGCLNLSDDYPHVLIVLGFGITGALTNVIIKLSIYAESQQDMWREMARSATRSMSSDCSARRSSSSTTGSACSSPRSSKTRARSSPAAGPLRSWLTSRCCSASGSRGSDTGSSTRVSSPTTISPRRASQ